MVRECTKINCNEKHFGKGLCKKHYSHDYHKKWYAKNRNKKLEQNKAYNKTDAWKKYKRDYERNRQHSDVLYKLKARVKARMYDAIKRVNGRKVNKTTEIVGCSMEFLKNYLSTKFTEGMSWDNYGKWHIDHIIPLASASTTEEVYKLSHYTNLQPLWASDNIKKRSKMPENASPST